MTQAFIPNQSLVAAMLRGGAHKRTARTSITPVAFGALGLHSTRKQGHCHRSALRELSCKYDENVKRMGHI